MIHPIILAACYWRWGENSVVGFFSSSNERGLFYCALWVLSFWGRDIFIGIECQTWSLLFSFMSSFPGFFQDPRSSSWKLQDPASLDFTNAFTRKLLLILWWTIESVRHRDLTWASNFSSFDIFLLLAFFCVELQARSPRQPFQPLTRPSLSFRRRDEKNSDNR
jgi:hypothetical protein